jgi:hypothetical protein
VAQWRPDIPTAEMLAILSFVMSENSGKCGREDAVDR